MIERFLYRLTQSPHASRFVLKGATLFAIWMDRPYRPTRDVDLLGMGDPDMDEARRIFVEICSVDVEPDGLRFEPESIAVTEIREVQSYAGIRVALNARLGKARIPLQIDIGFGDVITPAPLPKTLGPLLDFPPPVLSTYPTETVVAEKVETMVTLGMANSRMKDFSDLWIMSESMHFDGEVLVTAVRATLSRRQTDIPDTFPSALLQKFVGDISKGAQWRSFAERSGAIGETPSLMQVVERLTAFLGPLLQSASTGAPFPMVWHPRGPWRPPD